MQAMLERSHNTRWLTGPAASNHARNKQPTETDTFSDGTSPTGAQTLTQCSLTKTSCHSCQFIFPRGKSEPTPIFLAREMRTETNCSMPNGEIDGKQRYSVWIGAKTEPALQFVEHSINEGWEYVSILCVHQFSQRIAVEMNRTCGPSRADRVSNPAVEAPHAEVGFSPFVGNPSAAQIRSISVPG